MGRSRSAERWPGAAEVAPPRPGTVAPGTDGMTDAATANGDDRDPEIELFVKVGRRLGSRCTCSASSRAPGSGLTCPGRDRLGTLDRPRGGQPSPCGPLGGLSASRSLASGPSGRMESGAICRWPSSCRVGRQCVPAGRAVTAAGPERCPARCRLSPKGTSRSREMPRPWLDP